MSEDGKLSEIMGHDELLERLREDATPIDFDALIATGVLEKKGAWYKVLKLDGLPRHAHSKISSMQSGDGLLVKFRAPSKSLAKYLKNFE